MYTESSERLVATPFEVSKTFKLNNRIENSTIIYVAATTICTKIYINDSDRYVSQGQISTICGGVTGDAHY